MTNIDIITTIRAIDEALADAEPTWVTLPPVDANISALFRRALADFDAGAKPAAVAATHWLQQSALAQHQNSRTALYIGNGRIAGYYSLCNAQVELSQRQRKKLDLRTPIGTLPASLVTWLAKDHRADFDGELLVMHAAATARKATMTQASVALVLDPYDDETAEMWRTRFGFRRSSGSNADRLWVPLARSEA